MNRRRDRIAAALDGEREIGDRLVAVDQPKPDAAAKFVLCGIAHVVFTASTNVDRSSPSQQIKVRTANKISDRFKAVRSELNLTQQGLAQMLLLSRNYIAQIEMGAREPTVRVVNALEQLVDQRRAQSTNHPASSEGLKTGDKRNRVDAPSVRYSGGVASRIPQRRAPSTRADCEDYFRSLLDAADLGDDPNAFPVIHDRLKKEFPLTEWVPPKKDT